MSSVDNRVVQMQFNNSQFESGIKTSINSLDNLKKGLDLDGATKGLINLDNAGKSFSLAGIGESVDAIGSKFSALGVIGITALANITNSAINAGAQLLKSLTVEPVMAGLSEYETKMNAIQVILTNTKSKGTTIDDVNASLAELNTYADQTIYNFADMTKNIGTFTAAGIDLKTATGSIKGIANLAAGSGSNAEQASRAMYQLSQALSEGRMSLESWNSVTEAGMGGELFQNALVDKAVAMGSITQDLADNIKKGVVPFREAIKATSKAAAPLNITKDMMVSVFNDMANNADLIKAATEVKTFTQLIDTMKESVQSGWAQSWESIIGNKDQAAAMLTNINNAFGALIKPSTDARNAMLSFWNANGGRDAIITAVSTAFKSLMAILTPIHDAFREIFPVDTGERLVAFSIGIRDLVEKLKVSEETSNNIKRAFKGLFAVLDIGVRTVTFFAKCIGLIIGAFAPGTGGLLSGLLAGTAGIGDFLVAIRNVIVDSNYFGIALDKLGSAIIFIKDIITGTFDSAYSMMSPYIESIKTAADSSTFFYDALSKVKQIASDIQQVFIYLSSSASSTSSDAMAYGFVKLAEAGDLTNEALTWLDTMIKKITPALEKAGSVIQNTFGPAIEFIRQKLGELTLSDVGTVLAGGGLLLIGKSIKGAIDSIKTAMEPIQNIKESFSSVLDGITGSLEAFQTKLKAEALLKIAIAIAILAASVVALSMIDEEALKKALYALSTLFAQLGLALLVLDKTTASAPGISAKLIALGISILLLVSAMKQLGGMDPAVLSQGTQGLAAVLTVLAVFLKVTSGANMKTSITGLIGIALAVRLLVNSVAKFGEMDPAVLDQGIQGISAALVSLALFIRLVGKPERMVSIGIGLMAIGVAMRVFAASVEAFGSLPIDTLTKGLIGMSVALTSITIALRLMPSGAKSIESGAGLLIMSVALYAIAGAVAIFGSMSLETLAKGLGALAISLGLIAVTAYAMQNTLPGAAALLVMALAINMLVPAIALLGAMELTSIGIALLAIAGIFVVLGLSALILAPLTPVILALAISVGILGVGIALVGGGLVAMAAGLAAMAAGGSIYIAALTGLIVGIVNLIPFVATKLGEGLIALSVAIVGAMPYVMDALRALVMGLIALLVELTPPLTDAILQLLLILLVQLATYIEPVTAAAMDLIYGFIKGIADNIGKVTEVALDVIINFLSAISSKQGDIIDLAFQIIIDFINGLADAIDNNHDALFSACKKLIDAIGNAILDLAPGLVTVGENIIKGIMKGFASMATALVDAAKGVVGDAVKGVKDFLGIHSPSRVFAEIGKFSALGMAVGLRDFSGSVASAAVDVGDNAVHSLKNAMTNLSDTVNDNVDFNPTIRPVMDLSDVTSGVHSLNNLFDSNQGITVSSANAKTSSINDRILANNIQNGVSDTRTFNSSNDNTNGNSRPLSLQLVLQNGTAIAEYLLNDLDGMMGSKNQISGRMVGI